MEDKDLLNIWKSHDEKLESILTLNKKIVADLTKEKLNRTLGLMKTPKRLMLVIGIPYTMVIYLITFIGYKAGAFFVTLGFSMIGLIMTLIIIGYIYHLILINQISHSQEIVQVQKKLADLKISSFNLTRLAIWQLPFWSLCWISFDAFINSPLLYGGINLVVFVALAYLAYWLFNELSYDQNQSKVNRFFLSGIEWEPLEKSIKILDQLEEYQD